MPKGMLTCTNAPTNDVTALLSVRPNGAWNAAAGKAWITCSTSMVHDKCPPIKGNVRGRAEVAGLYVERNAADPAGKTDVTYIAAVNPAGWLPTWAVNLGAGKGAYCIDFLRKYVLKGERGDWKADA